MATSLPPTIAVVPVPSTVPPSLNTTLPVGRPLPGEVTLTVAVSVTSWPTTGDLDEVARATDVEACLTVWVAAVDVLPA